MKLKFIAISFYVVAVFNSQIFSQQAPVLVSPLDNSIMQKAVNSVLTWEYVGEETIYQVQYSLDSTFAPANLIDNVSIAGNRMSISNLQNLTTYYWRVRVDAPSAAWSEGWSFTTTGFPTAPVILSPADNATNLEPGNFTFSWTGGTYNTKYLLFIVVGSEETGDVYNYTVEDTFFVSPNIDYNDFHSWKVKAYNIDNVESEWSPTQVFKTALSIPSLLLPTDKVKNVDTTITISWRSVEGSSRYLFNLSKDSLFFNPDSLLEIETDSTSLVLDQLEFTTTYFWRLYAYDEEGDSSLWSAVRSFRTKIHPLFVSSPEDSVRNNDTTATFTWSAADNADNYSFQFTDDSLFRYSLIFDFIDSTSYEIDSLEYNKRYFWRVRAENETGDYSDWYSSTFKTLLRKPVNVFPVNKTKNVSILPEFTWIKSPGAGRYFLEISYDSLFSRMYADTVVTDSLFAADTLLWDTTYYWKVTSFNLQGDSSISSSRFSFKTRPALLMLPDEVDTTINLSVSRNDSLRTITISNYGTNAFVVDSIKLIPDTLFTINRVSAIINPDDEEKFYLSFREDKIDTGLTKGFVHFIRNNLLKDRDTLTVEINLNIRKAVSTFSDTTLALDSTDAGKKTISQIFINNRGGNISLRIDSLAIFGSDTASFKLINKPRSVNARDSAFFYLEFEPSRLGLHSVSIYIETNAFPDTIFVIPVTAAGRGGELAATTLGRLEELADTLFEAYTRNDRSLTFTNVGNAPVNISLRFAENKFKIKNDFQKDITVKRGDSVKVDIKYMITDFDEENTDTLKIIHNGFGKDTMFVLLEGTFDSLSSVKKFQQDIRLNSGQFAEQDLIIDEGTPLTFSLKPDLLEEYPHLSFRINYFTGGDGDRLKSLNDGSFNFNIPAVYANNTGILLWGDLLAVDKNNKLVDSIRIFAPLNYQVILKDYETTEIRVPKSKPAIKAEDADTKWIMFGFPFEEVVADSVFKDLGGIKNMKDGEWIMYNYNLADEDSFSLFSGYSLSPNSAYFIAQSLQDTFKMSYNYMQNLKTRKLTDTIITTPGTNWKTISSPFLFDVEVQNSVMLRKYDTNNKVYRMTNIMKPGEGYFVDPEVDRIIVKTYGQYDPLYYPSILKKIGWHLNINAAGKKSSNQKFISVLRDSKYLKNHDEERTEYSAAPEIDAGLKMYLLNDSGKKLDALVSEGAEGSVFDLVLSNKKHDDEVSLSGEFEGAAPNDFGYTIYNPELRSVSENNIVLVKGKEYAFKIIIGTSEYIEKTVAALSNAVPTQYSISQNYPNPFNPVTTIDYQVPQNSFVTIKVYDALGAETATLVNEQKTPGYYKLNFNASAFASGVYFYRIVAGSFVETKKMIILR